jgi:hypothetical protein
MGATAAAALPPRLALAATVAVRTVVVGIHRVAVIRQAVVEATHPAEVAAATPVVVIAKEREGTSERFLPESVSSCCK